MGITLRTSKLVNAEWITFLVEVVDVDVRHDEHTLLLNRKLVPLVHPR